MLKRTIQNLSLVIVSLVCCFIIAEAALRALYRHSPNYDYEMWRYASELKQPLYRPDLPFHHFPNRAGVYYGAEIRTNSLGFRGDEISVAKPSDRKRIVFLGDSHTLGWGVPAQSTCEQALEQTLRGRNDPAEVINMGIGNYNSQMEVELFKLKGLPLNPDIVVLMYYINDAEPTPVVHRLSYNVLRHSYLLGRLGQTFRLFSLPEAGRAKLSEYYRSIYEPQSPGRRASEASLQELFRICRERGIRLLVVNIPDLRKLREYPFQFATDYVRTAAEAAHVPFLDLLPVFSGHEGMSLWVSPEDPHMNARAHALAAGAISARLEEAGFLNSRSMKDTR